MNTVLGRREALISLGVGLGAGASLLVANSADAAMTTALPPGSDTLADLAGRLEKAPRRRDFKTVPMILNDPDQWDHEALTEIIGYRGGPRQVWDNVDITGPWLNLMRNTLNAQIWSYRHPNFLAVSATHATAHLALLDQAMWDKYQLTKLTGGKYERNSFLNEQKGAAADPADYENPDGVFSPHNNSIPALQRRGVVFMACHNAIWETSEKLIAAEVNPDKLPLDAMAAELTNHLIPGAVLTPGAVGTLPELAAVGFSFAK
jgi:hypothetical protein